MRDQPKSAPKIIDDVVDRLVALERDRTYRFQATRRADAERYVARSGAIVGCSDDELSVREAVLGGRYPDVFREFLLTLGRRSGRLFQGSDVGFDRHDELGRSAAELLAAEGSDEALPIDAEVFLVHQGCSFMYVRAVGGFDSPVYGFVEGQGTVKVESDSFAALVEAELALMEANDRASRDAGGTWIRVNRDRSITQTFPSRASGERPLDHPDDYLD
ncbi:MAG: SMI1/KNR4 family protein [Acidimicrobiia bacterium]|nr:SMI1/KNR4 family protein [Acidimicrobiia bacterium]MDH4309654.1 SMI1/KNR4 family protein [Acidimicrobiia bacterium]